MGTPTNRTPVRVARGTYSNLNTNKADIQGSEIVYATDQNKLYVKEGTDLIDAGTQDISGKADIASPTFTGTVAIPNIANLETAVTANTAKVTNVTTNLSVTANGTSLTVESSDGTNASIPAATTSEWGAMTDEDKTKLNGITTGANALLSADQTWTGAQRGTITALTDAATVAVDFNSSNNFSLLMTSGVGNTRVLGQPSNQTAGQSGSIFVTQDGTGSRALTYHGDWKWAGGSGSAPTLSTAANAVDRIDYIVAAANKIHAVATLAVA